MIEEGLKEENTLVVNFEDPRFTNLSLELLDKVYETYKEELEVGDEHLVVLDEVQEITALVKAMDEFELKEGIIITEDKEGQENINGKFVTYKPLWKWLVPSQ